MARLRSGAVGAIAYFAAQDVALKVLAPPTTVAAVGNDP